jgi:hypothetical protein
MEVAALAALRAHLDADAEACAEIEAGLADLDAGAGVSLETWLRTEGVARYEAWSAAPEDTLSSDEVREFLRNRRKG